MLFHPQILASSDEIGTKAEQGVDPLMIARRRSMISIVLNIQANQSHSNSIHQCQGVRRPLNPLILHVEKETNITDSTEEVSRGSEFLATSNNLEHLALELSLELRVEFVPEICKRYG